MKLLNPEDVLTPELIKEWIDEKFPSNDTDAAIVAIWNIILEKEKSEEGAILGMNLFMLFNPSWWIKELQKMSWREPTITLGIIGMLANTIGASWVFLAAGFMGILIGTIPMRNQTKPTQKTLASNAIGAFAAGAVATIGTAAAIFGVFFAVPFIGAIPALAAMGLTSMLGVPMAVNFFSAGIRIIMAFIKHGGIRGPDGKLQIGKLLYEPIAETYPINKNGITVQIARFTFPFQSLTNYHKNSIFLHEGTHLKGYSELTAHLLQGLYFPWITFQVFLANAFPMFKQQKQQPYQPFLNTIPPIDAVADNILLLPTRIKSLPSTARYINLQIWLHVAGIGNRQQNKLREGRELKLQQAFNRLQQMLSSQNPTIKTVIITLSKHIRQLQLKLIMLKLWRFPDLTALVTVALRWIGLFIIPAILISTLLYSNLWAGTDIAELSGDLDWVNIAPWITGIIGAGYFVWYWLVNSRRIINVKEESEIQEQLHVKSMSPSGVKLTHEKVYRLADELKSRLGINFDLEIVPNTQDEEKRIAWTEWEGYELKKIFFSEEFLDMLGNEENSDAIIAAILSHEIAHALNNDLQFRREVNSLIDKDDSTSQLLHSDQERRYTYYTTLNEHVQIEADKKALEFMAILGYTPDVMLRAFDKAIAFHSLINDGEIIAFEPDPWRLRRKILEDTINSQSHLTDVYAVIEEVSYAMAVGFRYESQDHIQNAKRRAEDVLILTELLTNLANYYKVVANEADLAHDDMKALDKWFQRKVKYFEDLLGIPSEQFNSFENRKLILDVAVQHATAELFREFLNDKGSDYDLYRSSFIFYARQFEKILDIALPEDAKFQHNMFVKLIKFSGSSPSNKSKEATRVEAETEEAIDVEFVTKDETPQNDLIFPQKSGHLEELVVDTVPKYFWKLIEVSKPRLHKEQKDSNEQRNELKPNDNDSGTDINLAAAAGRRVSHRKVNAYIAQNLPQDIIENPVNIQNDNYRMTKGFGRQAKVIPIYGLLKHTNQFAHIGLGQMYNTPVIYIDSDYMENQDVLEHELYEIAKWEEKRNELGLESAQMRQWIIGNYENAYRLAELWHILAPSVEHLYIRHYEFMADFVGQYLAVWAGFSPNGLVSLFSLFSKGKTHLPKLNRWLRRLQLLRRIIYPELHPSYDKRIARLEQRFSMVGQEAAHIEGITDAYSEEQESEGKQDERDVNLGAGQGQKDKRADDEARLEREMKLKAEFLELVEKFKNNLGELRVSIMEQTPEYRSIVQRLGRLFGKKGYRLAFSIWREEIKGKAGKYIDYDKDIYEETSKREREPEIKMAFLEYVELFKEDLSKLSYGSMEKLSKESNSLLQRINNLFGKGGYRDAFTKWATDIERIVGKPVDYDLDIMQQAKPDPDRDKKLFLEAVEDNKDDLSALSDRTFRENPKYRKLYNRLILKYGEYRKIFDELREEIKEKAGRSEYVVYERDIRLRARGDYEEDKESFLALVKLHENELWRLSPGEMQMTRDKNKLKAMSPEEKEQARDKENLYMRIIRKHFPETGYKGAFEEWTKIDYESEVAQKIRADEERDKQWFLDLVKKYKDDLHQLSSTRMQYHNHALLQRLDRLFADKGGYPWAFIEWRKEIRSPEIAGREVNYYPDVVPQQRTINSVFGRYFKKIKPLLIVEDLIYRGLLALANPEKLNPSTSQEVVAQLSKHLNVLATIAITKRERGESYVSEQVQMELLHKLIGQLLRNGGKTAYPLVNIALGLEPPKFTGIEDIPKQVALHNARIGDDETQYASVRMALNEISPVTLIHGPPGTGKTTVIAEIVQQYVDRGKRVLVVSQDNDAVDNVLRLLSDSGMQVGRATNVSERVTSESFQWLKSDSDLQRFFSDPSAKVVGSTLVSLATVKAIAEQPAGFFDVVVFDEAGRAKMPQSLLALAIGRNAKLVLVGDHKQLAPFPYTAEQDVKLDNSSGELDVSLFEKLIDAGFDQIMLDTNYRSHPFITALISMLFYDEKLKPRKWRDVEDSAALRERVVVIDTSQLDEANTVNLRTRHSNPLEADIIVERLKDLEAEGMDIGKVGIITFYNEQVETINQRISLARKNGELQGAPHVGNVHESQGREWDIVIVSSVRSDPDHPHRVGFVSDLGLLNVAFSRAKQRLVVVGDFKTLRNAQEKPEDEITRRIFQQLEDYFMKLQNDIDSFYSSPVDKPKPNSIFYRLARAFLPETMLAHKIKFKSINREIPLSTAIGLLGLIFEIPVLVLFGVSAFPAQIGWVMTGWLGGLVPGPVVSQTLLGPIGMLVSLVVFTLAHIFLEKIENLVRAYRIQRLIFKVNEITGRLEDFIDAMGSEASSYDVAPIQRELESLKLILLKLLWQSYHFSSGSGQTNTPNINMDNPSIITSILSVIDNLLSTSPTQNADKTTMDRFIAHDGIAFLLPLLKNLISATNESLTHVDLSDKSSVIRKLLKTHRARRGGLPDYIDKVIRNLERFKEDVSDESSLNGDVLQFSSKQKVLSQIQQYSIKLASYLSSLSLSGQKAIPSANDSNPAAIIETLIHNLNVTKASITDKLPNTPDMYFLRDLLNNIVVALKENITEKSNKVNALERLELYRARGALPNAKATIRTFLKQFAVFAFYPATFFILAIFPSAHTAFLAMPVAIHIAYDMTYLWPDSWLSRISLRQGSRGTIKYALPVLLAFIIGETWYFALPALLLGLSVGVDALLPLSIVQAKEFTSGQSFFGKGFSWLPVLGVLYQWGLAHAEVREGFLESLRKMGLERLAEQIERVWGESFDHTFMTFTRDINGRLKILIGEDVIREYEKAGTLEEFLKVSLIHEILESSGLTHRQVESYGFGVDSYITNGRLSMAELVKEAEEIAARNGIDLQRHVNKGKALRNDILLELKKAMPGLKTELLKEKGLGFIVEESRDIKSLSEDSAGWINLLSLVRLTDLFEGETVSVHNDKKLSVDRAELQRLIPYMNREELADLMAKAQELYETRKGREDLGQSFAAITVQLFLNMGALEADGGNKDYKMDFAGTVFAYQKLARLIFGREVELGEKLRDSLDELWKAGKVEADELANTAQIMHVEAYITEDYASNRVKVIDVSSLSENTVGLLLTILNKIQRNEKGELPPIVLLSDKERIDVEAIRHALKTHGATPAMLETFNKATDYGKRFLSGSKTVWEQDKSGVIFDTARVYEGIQRLLRSEDVPKDVDLFTEHPGRFRNLSWRDEIRLRILAIVSSTEVIDVGQTTDKSLKAIQRALQQA